MRKDELLPLNRLNRLKARADRPPGLAGTRRILAPLALAVGAFVMLFNGLRLLVTNWRLMLVQTLPAMWIWAATYDLKAKVLRGEAFHDIRGPVVLVLFAVVVLITIAAFYLNAAFAFAISQPGPPDLRGGFRQARKHVKTVTGWGTDIGLALAVATMLARGGGRAGSRSCSASSWPS